MDMITMNILLMYNLNMSYSNFVLLLLAVVLTWKIVSSTVSKCDPGPQNQS